MRLSGARGLWSAAAAGLLAACGAGDAGGGGDAGDVDVVEADGAADAATEVRELEDGAAAEVEEVVGEVVQDVIEDAMPLDVADPAPDEGVADTVAPAEPDAVADADTAPEPDAGAEPDADPPPVPATNDCITTLAPGHHVFECFGFDFDVEVPPACTSGGCGLVVDVHGFTMSAQMQDDNTGMRALGQKHGYVVVQPNAKGLPAAWSNTGGDDDEIWEMVQRAVSAYAIDPKRLHFTGFSQGGFMTWRFLCKHADSLASVAPAAGSSWVTGVAGCKLSGGEMPAMPIPVLYMHGRKDGVVPYALATPQHEAVIEGWDLTQTAVVSKDGDHEWTRWEGPNGALYEHIAHDWVASSFLLTGHCYPGSGDQNGGAPGQLFGFGCTPPNALTWGEAAMAFFMAHPKP